MQAGVGIQFTRPAPSGSHDAVPIGPSDANSLEQFRLFFGISGLEHSVRNRNIPAEPPEPITTSAAVTRIEIRTTIPQEQGWIRTFSSGQTRRRPADDDHSMHALHPVLDSSCVPRRLQQVRVNQLLITTEIGLRIAPAADTWE